MPCSKSDPSHLDTPRHSQSFCCPLHPCLGRNFIVLCPPFGTFGEPSIRSQLKVVGITVQYWSECTVERWICLCVVKATNVNYHTSYHSGNSQTNGKKKQEKEIKDLPILIQYTGTKRKKNVKYYRYNVSMVPVESYFLFLPFNPTLPPRNSAGYIVPPDHFNHNSLEWLIQHYLWNFWLVVLVQICMLTYTPH